DGHGVVEVAALGWSAAAGEHAGGVGGFDPAALGGSGAAAGGAYPDRKPGGGVGDLHLPGRAVERVGSLAGEVGDDGISVLEVAGLLGSDHEGGEVACQPYTAAG